MKPDETTQYKELQPGIIGMFWDDPNDGIVIFTRLTRVDRSKAAPFKNEIGWFVHFAPVTDNQFLEKIEQLKNN